MDKNKDQKSSREYVPMWKFVIIILVTIILAGVVIYSEHKDYNKDINQYKQKIKSCNMTLENQIESCNIGTDTLYKNISDLRSELYTLKQRLSKKIPDEQLTIDIANYIHSNFPTIPNVLFNEIAKQIAILSQQENVSPELIIGIIQVESSFNPMVISKKNARGLMQVMPMWTKKFGIKKVCDLHNIKIGIWAGIKVLKIHIKEQKGNLSKGLYYYVNKDRSYVTRVYTAMGKFVMFRSKPSETKEGELDDTNSTAKSNDK